MCAGPKPRKGAAVMKTLLTTLAAILALMMAGRVFTYVA